MEIEVNGSDVDKCLRRGTTSGVENDERVKKAEVSPSLQARTAEDVKESWDFLLTVHGDTDNPIHDLLVELLQDGFTQSELIGLCYTDGVLHQRQPLLAMLTSLRDRWRDNQLPGG